MMTLPEDACAIRDIAYRQGEEERVQRGLEIAAALGCTVAWREWRLAGEASGVLVREEWVDALVARGLARRESDGWAFSDETLRTRLDALARRAGRWRSHHAACAQALYRLDASGCSQTASRRAAHLERAGRREDALQAIFEAVDAAFADGKITCVEGYLERVEALIAGIDRGDLTISRARADWRQARYLITVAEPKQARELIGPAVGVLADTTRIGEYAHAEMIYARMLRNSGELDAALQRMEEAAAQFAMCGDERGLATSRAGAGLILLMKGEHSRAREAFDRALDTAEALADYGRVCELYSFIAHTHLADEEYEEAARFASRARDVAQQHDFTSHEATAWNALGEIARANEQYSQARRCYQKAVEFYERAQELNAHIARYNLALVEIGDSKFDRARQLLEVLRVDLADGGMHSRLPLVYSALMTCAVGQGDWSAWSVFHDHALETIERTGAGHTDIVWAARRASAIAAAQERLDISEQADALVRAQLERIG